MLILRKPWTIQPPDNPQINWEDPITSGLVGFVWAGYGAPRDLVNPQLSLATTGTTIGPKQHGIASIVGTGANSGVYTPRTDYQPWRPTTVPITFAAFVDHTTPAGSRPIAGTLYSSTGYGFWDLFGTRDRRAAAKIGGTNRTRDSGRWATGAKVRALTATDTTLTGYDDGVSFGTTSFASATSLDYEGTFDRLYLLGSPDNSSSAGEGYWLALWNRPLSPAEHARLAREPWCMLEPLEVRIPVSVASGGGISGDFAATLADVTLSAAGVLPITGTFAASLDAVTLSASGSLAITGTASQTLAGVTLSAAGALAITGSLSATLDAVTLSAAGAQGTINTGSLAVTLADVTLSAAGVLPITGASSLTLDGATLAATGVLPIEGAAAITLDGVTLAAEGASLTPITGTLAVTLEGVTLSASNATSGGIGLAGGFDVEIEPKLWWQRKPKRIKPEEAKQAIKAVAKVVKEKAEEHAAEREPVAQRRADVKQAVAPLVSQMPGFDWRPIYDEAYDRALTAAIAQQMREREAQAAQHAAALARQIDDDEVALLAAML